MARDDDTLISTLFSELKFALSLFALYDTFVARRGRGWYAKGDHFGTTGGL